MVYPTCVGMSRTVSHFFSLDSGLSRMRGNESTQAAYRVLTDRFVPHEWK